MPEVTRIILNPASSNGGGARLKTKLELRLKARRIAYDIVESRERGHVEELARAAANAGVPRILAVGGDGTIHEIANGLLRAGVSPPPVAILPVGTGNDFFRMVGAVRGVEAALDTLQHGIPRYFDVGVAQWPGGQCYFVNLLGVGVDVEVLRRRERFQRLPGITQYLAALLAAVARFQPVALHARIDEEERMEAHALLCAVTVGPSAGGGFLLTPDALPDDGLLDLCLIGKLGLIKILRYIPKVISGKHKGLSDIHLRQFKRLRLEPADGVPFSFQLDGDLVSEEAAWLDVGLRGGCFPILLPAKGGGR